MSGAKFVRLYPSDWRSGCIGLSLEQEGFYIRLCSFIYDTDKRLPSDDKIAAKLMGLHTNAYRKVRDQLAALGKIVFKSGVWTVPRADRELAAATNSARAKDRQTDQNTGRNTCTDTLEDTPTETPIVFSKNTNEINGALKSQEPRANIREEDNYDRPNTGLADGREDISGLNGSTGEIVNGVAKFLNALAPDTVTAKRIIASNVAIYGSTAVRDGFAELMADVADNKVRVPSVKALVGYFKTASDRPRRDQNRPQQPSNQPTVSELLRRKREQEIAA